MKTTTYPSTTETPAAAAQPAPVASAPAAPAKRTHRANAAPKARKTARKPATKKPAAIDPRPRTKAASILALLARKGGVTREGIQKQVGWLPHSVRGFLSTAGRKYAITITSTLRKDGKRVYACNGLR